MCKNILPDLCAPRQSTRPAPALSRMPSPTKVTLICLPALTHRQAFFRAYSLFQVKVCARNFSLIAMERSKKQKMVALRKAGKQISVTFVGDGILDKAGAGRVGCRGAQG